MARDKVEHDVLGRVLVTRHGTAHQGPVGQQVVSEEFSVGRAAALAWQENCGGSRQSCMQGPSEGQGGTLGGHCQGLHPLPVMFPDLLELEPGVNYLLSLNMVEVMDGVSVRGQMGTVWGYQGVPRRRRSDQQNYFRWFTVHRPGLRSSLTGGQFPIIYYIA